MPEQLARLLAHPLRDRVLFEYRGEPASPSEVARRLGRPLNLVSYHTRVLERHGCVELVREVRRRGALTRYFRAIAELVIDDDEWTRLTVARRRHLALETLDRVEREAGHAILAGTFDGVGSHLAHAPIELDEQGVEELSAALRRALDRITAIADASASGGPNRSAVFAVILGFQAGP